MTKGTVPCGATRIHGFLIYLFPFSYFSFPDIDFPDFPKGMRWRNQQTAQYPTPGPKPKSFPYPVMVSCHTETE